MTSAPRPQPSSSSTPSSTSTPIFKLDIHTHILPKTLPDFGTRYGYGGFITVDGNQEKVESPGNVRIMKDGKVFREVPQAIWDVEHRVAEMDRDGINVQVVSTMPILFNYWAKADDTADLARILNNDLKKEISKFPKRFIGLGTLPMQAPELAIKELTRCMVELGFAGVQIGSHVNEWNLDATELIPFWEAAEELGACVVVHPWDDMMALRPPKLDRQYMMNDIVHLPTETTRAITAVILGGVLDRFPKLKLMFSHGGGFFPYTQGRMDHAYNRFPHISDIESPPRTFHKKFCCDSLVFSSGSLKLLVDVLGSENVMFGTNFPVELCESSGFVKGMYAGKYIEELKTLTDKQKRSLYGLNALRFLGRELDEFV